MSNTFIPTWKCLFWDENDKYTEEIVTAATIYEAGAPYDIRDGRGSVLPTKESCDFFDANPGEKEKAYAPPPYPEYKDDLTVMKSVMTKEVDIFSVILGQDPIAADRVAKSTARLILHLIDSK